MDHDVDWFCVINGTPIHVASAGDKLPKCVDSVRHNVKNQIIARNHSDINDVNELTINESYINDLLNSVNLNENQSLSEIRERYLETFINMAKKGFVSFDKMIPNDRNDHRYIWIVKPKNSNKEITSPMVKIEDFDFENSEIDLITMINKASNHISK